MKTAFDPDPRFVDNEDEDDWLFASMKRYKNLHMFDLQYPVKSLAWVNSNTICVATRKPVGAEILELNLPEKLLAETREDEGLCNSRDFHLPSGGLCERHIVDVKCIPESRLVFCSHEADNSVSVWQLGTDTKDVIQEVKILKNISPNSDPSLIALHDNHVNKVAFGSTTSNISLSDVETGENLYNTLGCTNSSRLIGLDFQKENIILTCTQQGHFNSFDIREKPPTNSVEIFNPDPKDSCAAMCVKDDVVAVATRRGKIILKDLRSAGDVCSLDTGLCSGGADVCVQFSPSQDNVLSLSGYNQNVNVYNYQQDTICPLFVHDGHWKADGLSTDVKIWTHSWHPEQSHLVLSSGTDGSLHAWDYVTDVS
ncbi:WD repeat-containing protein 73-like isoform X2 [Lineus longissimus]